jgi:hypothetical protein
MVFFMSSGSCGNLSVIPLSTILTMLRSGVPPNMATGTLPFLGSSARTSKSSGDGSPAIARDSPTRRRRE